MLATFHFTSWTTNWVFFKKKFWCCCGCLWSELSVATHITGQAPPQAILGASVCYFMALSFFCYKHCLCHINSLCGAGHTGFSCMFLWSPSPTLPWEHVCPCPLLLIFCFFWPIAFINKLFRIFYFLLLLLLLEVVEEGTACLTMVHVFSLPSGGMAHPAPVELWAWDTLKLGFKEAEYLWLEFKQIISLILYLREHCSKTILSIQSHLRCHSHLLTMEKEGKHMNSWLISEN